MKIEQLVRANILKLKPYSSARSEFKGMADVFLDANENPFQTGLNRYPDPLQRLLKKKIGGIKDVDERYIFLGNGSDEVIDLLIRIFCEPGKDEIVTLPPTYGMYRVSADISDVSVKEVELDDEFQPRVEAILNASGPNSKILFVCSPNNPTGTAIDEKRIISLLEQFRGIVVIDEAYIDFSKERSFSRLVDKYPNLVVMQTFSKAWGLAGIRLGMAFANKVIIDLLNNVKPPYNVNQLTQEAALRALENQEVKTQWVETILEERERLHNQLQHLSIVVQVHPSDANFLLVKVTDPDDLYRYLVGEKIIVRNRSKVQKCAGCIRITVGTKGENNQLIKSLEKYKAS